MKNNKTNTADNKTDLQNQVIAGIHEAIIETQQFSDNNATGNQNPVPDPKEIPEIEPEKAPIEEPGIQPDIDPDKNDDDDDDDDDQPGVEPPVGDDPDEIKKKIPIM